MIGIDAVDVERLRTVMARSAGAESRLFTEDERTYCHSRVDPVIHFAGTLAVKEAVIKAARLGPLMAWGRRIEVRRDPSGAPRVNVHGAPQHRFDISISHDGPVAVAVAVSRDRVTLEDHAQESDRAQTTLLKPNEQLLRYIGGSAGKTPTPRQCLGDASRATLGTDFP